MDTHFLENCFLEKKENSFHGEISCNLFHAHFCASSYNQKHAWLQSQCRIFAQILPQNKETSTRTHFNSCFMEVPNMRTLVTSFPESALRLFSNLIRLTLTRHLKKILQLVPQNSQKHKAPQKKKTDGRPHLRTDFSRRKFLKNGIIEIALKRTACRCHSARDMISPGPLEQRYKTPKVEKM